MHVGGVPGQQNPAFAVGNGLPRHVREPGDPVGAAKSVVRPVHAHERVAELAHGGVTGVVDVSLREDDPDRLPILPSPQSMLADAIAPKAELRLLVHLDLGDHPAGGGIQPGELDTGGLADHAAPAVAPDEVLRSKRRAVGQLDIDAGVVLAEADYLAATEYRNPELTDPISQDGLELALPQRQHVVVAAREVADVQEGAAVPLDRGDVPRGE